MTLFFLTYFQPERRKRVAFLMIFLRNYFWREIIFKGGLFLEGDWFGREIVVEGTLFLGCLLIKGTVFRESFLDFKFVLSFIFIRYIRDVSWRRIFKDCFLGPVFLSLSETELSISFKSSVDLLFFWIL